MTKLNTDEQTILDILLQIHQKQPSKTELKWRKIFRENTKVIFKAWQDEKLSIKKVAELALGWAELSKERAEIK